MQRKDACGAWIVRSQYGDVTERGFGWEIDHIDPVSNGGADDPWNLQPLQWQNNREKGDKCGLLPFQYCAVKATN
jgi:HNH endonuclease